jgi:hypothetical protein
MYTKCLFGIPLQRSFSNKSEENFRFICFAQQQQVTKGSRQQLQHMNYE